MNLLRLPRRIFVQHQSMRPLPLLAHALIPFSIEESCNPENMTRLKLRNYSNCCIDHNATQHTASRQLDSIARIATQHTASRQLDSIAESDPSTPPVDGRAGRLQ
ncbi:hypothetical protein R4769_16825 [Azotobacter beijerinckii]|nr:hypothetical protein [Azotobacter beijerinckii]